MWILLEDWLPSEAQKIGGEGALAKVTADYQSQEQQPQGRRAESPGLKQPSRCFQSWALCADRAEAEALVNRSWNTAKDLSGFVPHPFEQHSPKEACCRKFLELNVLFQASRDHIPLIK